MLANYLAFLVLSATIHLTLFLLFVCSYLCPGENMCADGYGILSFKFNNIDSNDLMSLIGDKVFIRTAGFCLLENSDNYIRVSLHIYNSKQEIDEFITILKNIFK